MVSRVDNYYVRDVAVVIAAMARNGQRKQVEESIGNISAVGCDESVVMRRIGNVANSISISNARREGLLRNGAF